MFFFIFFLPHRRRFVPEFRPGRLPFDDRLQLGDRLSGRFLTGLLEDLLDCLP